MSSLLLESISGSTSTVKSGSRGKTCSQIVSAGQGWAVLTSGMVQRFLGLDALTALSAFSALGALGGFLDLALT